MPSKASDSSRKAVRRPGSRHALVLGPRLTGRQIARQLEELGFTAHIHAEITDPGLFLPSPAAPGARQALESLLEWFAREHPATDGRANILHPGTSLWAESAELPVLGQQHGLSVVCPSSRALSLFGNKLNLMAEAEKLGIPNLVLDFTPLHGAREIERFAAGAERGFPLVLKSARGSGSRGICVFRDPADLEKRLPLWLEQVRLNFGEVFLFGERCLEGARSVLVPFARGMDGLVTVFPEVDTSLQSRHRKLVQFCPAESIDERMVAKLTHWTATISEHVGYVGVGSLEFLIDGDRAYLIDALARLNLEFHLWERVAGTRAVAWQLAQLEGAPASESPPFRPRAEWTSGLSARICAEDSLLHLPQPGKVREISEARGWAYPGVEAELHLEVQAGEVVSPRGQGTVAVLYVGASGGRAQTTLVARGILDEIWIAGSLQTNERFLAELLGHPWVREGVFHAAFVDEEFLPSVRPPEEISGLMVSMLQWNPRITQSVEPGQRWVVGDQWAKPDPASVQWHEGPQSWEDGGLQGISGEAMLTDGRHVRVCAHPLVEGKWQVRAGNWVLGVRRLPPKTAPGARGVPLPKIAAIVPGRIHSIHFREGVIVPAHEMIAVVESLGALIPHALPSDVRLLRWKVSAEDEVAAGQELAEFELLPKSP